jgi:hypothetical protein
MSRQLNYLSMVDTLLDVKLDDVNEWEERFLIDMKKRYADCPQRLSERQQEVILNIYNKYITRRP